MTHTTDGPEATRALAAEVAVLLEAGDVVALAGDLGAGKTCFVQGAAVGLGIEARVTSPTFVLVREYVGRVPVIHTDVYRLDRLADVADLGDDVLGPDVVTFIEWADAVRPLLPDDRLEVEVRRPADGDGDGSAGAGGSGGAGAGGSGGAGDGDEVRVVVLRAYGARWADRADALQTAGRDGRSPDLG
ncbi:MAG: tRNA (adenosine(37)-N6)-threonylcarbamoyltransferase complex ATPase subunit type 1 TsaE [Nitriliruptoraceae bacterium]|nr:tRNA (adenosine(37)-N6)-threonylcarbamoyltransferase complex ATPase subunit type 1 TsaE [Nitriliruptoraceae bacterium]